MDSPDEEEVEDEEEDVDDFLIEGDLEDKTSKIAESLLEGQESHSLDFQRLYEEEDFFFRKNQCREVLRVILTVLSTVFVILASIFLGEHVLQENASEVYFEAQLLLIRLSEFPLRRCCCLAWTETCFKLLPVVPQDKSLSSRVKSG